jgi:phosphoglycolate phosphatase-like HAD superfamily hydrolase
MTTRCILWDFGGTLADQNWMLMPPDEFPDWPKAWREVARGELEEPWCLGKVTCEDIANRIAELLKMPKADTMDHIRRCCSNVRFFDAVMATARDSSLPQAIVTVNPDVFTNYVVPHYQLDELFSVIVASWQEGTTDKAELCARAVKRLGKGFGSGEAFLVDNIEANVRAWEARGGHGYVFVDNNQFAADLQTVLREMTMSPRTLRWSRPG